jgi:hypothetical protein
LVVEVVVVGVVAVGGLVVEVVVEGVVAVGGWLVAVGGWLVVVVVVVVAGCLAAELLLKLKAVNASAITSSGCQRLCMDNLRSGRPYRLTILT